MKATTSQLRRLHELHTRLLTRQGADQLIRALLRCEDGDKGPAYSSGQVKVDADPALVDALRPHVRETVTL